MRNLSRFPNIDVLKIHASITNFDRWSLGFSLELRYASIPSGENEM
jgi:hypothetical protein